MPALPLSISRIVFSVRVLQLENNFDINSAQIYILHPPLIKREKSLAGEASELSVSVLALPDTLLSAPASKMIWNVNATLGCWFGVKQLAGSEICIARRRRGRLIMKSRGNKNQTLFNALLPTLCPGSISDQIPLPSSISFRLLPLLIIIQNVRYKILFTFDFYLASYWLINNKRTLKWR